MGCREIRRGLLSHTCDQLILMYTWHGVKAELWHAQVTCAGFINSDLPGLPVSYHQPQGKPLRYLVCESRHVLHMLLMQGAMFCFVWAGWCRISMPCTAPLNAVAGDLCSG